MRLRTKNVRQKVKVKKAKGTEKRSKITGKKRLAAKIYIFGIIKLLTAPALVFLSVFLRDSLTRYTLTAALSTLLLSAFFMLTELSEYTSMPYKNAAHPVRNLVVFAGISFLCAFCAFIPEFIIPVASLCLIYMILSSFKTGTTASLLFVSMIMIVTGEGGWLFLYYFSCAFLLMLLYSKPGYLDRIVLPLLLFSALRISLFALIVILPDTNVTPQLMIAAAGGLILDLVIASVGVYRLRQDVVKRTSIRLTAISDPEHPLLKELRNESRDEFFRAVHTAYLCKNCAVKIGADEYLARALGYYHRIGVLRGDNMNIPQKTLSIATENEFEPELIELIREYGAISGGSLSKETSIVIICDSLVSAVTDKFKYSDSVDYDEMIDYVMDFYKKDNHFSQSLLSLKELDRIEKCLKGEKLYYDFLR